MTSDARMKCPHCHRNLPLDQFHTTGYHRCTEESRLQYWANIGSITGNGAEAPPREEDACCAGIFVLCEKCWAILRPEERLKYHLDVLMRWHFEDEEERVRVETEICGRVLAS